jgi:Raf kinase inhibitor-like YbhB/YbcL family protein
MQIRHALGSLAIFAAVAIAQPAGAVTAYPIPLATPIIPPGVPALTVTSTSVPSGGTISPKYMTCPGLSNISPQLSWTPGPAGTKSYVVEEFDTDAPTGVGFHQWVVFNIPPSVTSLPEGAAKDMVQGAVQGYNDGGYTGYRGGCAPVGDAPHHYFYTVTAMDTVFQNVGPNTTGTWIEFLMSKAGHILARGQMFGLFGHP